jgi:hypothetical protein
MTYLRSVFSFLVVALCLDVSAALPRAEEPGKKAEPGRAKASGLDRVWQGVHKRAQKLEAVQMFEAILDKGADLGPGDGWFHPSQSRYGWDWLAAWHKIDPKASIERKAFRGTPELFERLDRNRDGVLNADDFDWSDRSAFARQSMPANMWFRALDTNSNGRVSREEWLALFDKASKGKGYLTADDLRQAFPVTPPPRPATPPPNAKSEMPSKATLIAGLFSGEIGSVFEGPKIGQKAPPFTLPRADGTGTISLAQLNKKPVVLIFGSFT